MKKRAKDDVVMDDTVENQVKGLAQQIIAEDEKRRAQELVSLSLLLGHRAPNNLRVVRMCSTLRQNGRIGI